MSKIQGRRLRALVFAVAIACALYAAANAGSTTTTFNTQIATAAACATNSAATLNYTQGMLAAKVDQTSTFQVLRHTTQFTIGFEACTGSGTTVAARELTSGSNTVNYAFYSDAAHTMIWGNTPSTDTLADAGTRSGQNFTVYGRAAPQAAPAPGNYSDTITVTVM
jgi:spore coat protein U-like protein